MSKQVKSTLLPPLNLRQVHKTNIQKAIQRLSKGFDSSKDLKYNILQLTDLPKELKDNINDLLQIDDNLCWLEQKLCTLKKLITEAGNSHYVEARIALQSKIQSIIKELYQTFDDLEFYLHMKLQNINIIKLPCAETISTDPINDEYSHIEGVEGDSITINHTPIKVLFSEDDLSPEERANRISLAINASKSLTGNVQAASDGLGRVYLQSIQPFSIQTSGNGRQLNIEDGHYSTVDKFIKQVDKAMNFVNAKQERLTDCYEILNETLEHTYTVRRSTQAQL